MKFVNGIINDILDTVFGKVYIATTSADTNMFTFLYDLIVLACYIFMFKHFCSFLTTLLTSVLKFDGSGFSGNTGDSSGGGAFGSSIVSQFAGAIGFNKNNWQKLTGAMSNTRGFRRVGQMAQRFTPFDQQGNLSFGAALKSVPNVKKGFDTLRQQGKFESLKNRDRKKEEFLKSRKEERQMNKNNKGLNDMFKAGNDLLKEKGKLDKLKDELKSKADEKHIRQNANKFMSKDTDGKKKNQIKKQEMIRYQNSLARQIDEVYTSYHDSIDNGADEEQIAELQYKLEELTQMAVNAKLISDDERNTILSSKEKEQPINIKRATNEAGVDKFKLQTFEAKGKVLTMKKFRISVKDLKAEYNKKNADTIVNLSKLAQQGLIDASLFTDMGDNMINKWAEGNITKGEYERVMKYIKDNNSIDKVNEELEYMDRDNLDFNDLMLYEEIYVNSDEYEKIEHDDSDNKDKKNAEYVLNKVKNRQSIVRKNIVTKAISLKQQNIKTIEQQLEQEKRTLVEEMNEMKKIEVDIGLSEDNIKLSPEEPDIAAMVDTEFEKSFEYFESECNICAGIENNPDAEENALTKQEEENLKHGESMLKVVGIKLKVEEFNKQKCQQKIDVLQLELESSTKSHKEKQKMKSRIHKLNTEMEKSGNIIKDLEDKKNKINKRVSSIKDKQNKSD